MASTGEVVTLTDEQLSDIRETFRAFTELMADLEVTVRTGSVEIADGKVVQVRFNEATDEWVVDL